MLRRVAIGGAGLVTVGILVFAGNASGVGLSAGASPIESTPKSIESTPKSIAPIPNPEFLAELSSQAWASPPDPNAAIITREEAENIARLAILASNTAPVASQLMTGTEFENLTGVQRGPYVNEDRQVWVVTVSGTFHTDGVGPTSEQSGYSIVIDAESGLSSDDCIGCVWLTSSK
jgi:hypothetical protein